MGKQNRQHAIVIGGSMAGLLTARVLSDHFEQVTLLERDKINDLPESRKGQPQTRHLHALLAEGFAVMKKYFPDLAESLEEGGAVVNDITKNMRWHCYGDYRVRFQSGLIGVLSSRPFLEWQVRQRVTALKNVSVLDQASVMGLETTPDKTRITGIKFEHRGDTTSKDGLVADLVVDVSGRGSRTPKWLESLGYDKPEESVVTVSAGYATRVYKRDPEAADARDWIFITPEAPKEQRMGGAFPVEGERWIVSLGGWHGDHAQDDEAGFIDYAKSLNAPDVYDIITHNEPLSDIILHKYPSSLRHHYEKLGAFPEGYLVLGDALCSFNPLYGQGMTSAALQAETLDKVLKENPASHILAKTFFKRAAKVVDIPWQTAVGEDFRFPQTVGPKAPGTDFINGYTALVQRATHADPVVCKSFIEVLNLRAPPTSLFYPNIVWRVLRHRFVPAARAPTANRANA